MLDPNLFRKHIDVTASRLARRGFELPVARISALLVPVRRLANSWNGTAGTSTWMSIRSSNGPLILPMYFSICGPVQ